MKKAIIIILLVTILVVCLYGCSNSKPSRQDYVPSEYEEWKASENATDLNVDGSIDESDYSLFKEYMIWCDTEDAQDFNGDRKITYLDFAYFNAYKNWKLSSNSLDLDGDRKIGINDYALFINPDKINFVSWMESENAVDLNDDNIVNEDDYVIASPYVEFIGRFRLANFEYVGNNACLDNSQFALSDLMGYVSQIYFDVNVYGNVSWSCPEQMRRDLGADGQSVEYAISSSYLTRISPQVAVWTTETYNFSLTIYLVKTESGYSTSFNHRRPNVETTISFDIVYGN